MAILKKPYKLSDTTEKVSAVTSFAPLQTKSSQEQKLCTQNDLEEIIRRVVKGELAAVCETIKRGDDSDTTLLRENSPRKSRSIAKGDLTTSRSEISPEARKRTPESRRGNKTVRFDELARSASPTTRYKDTRLRDLGIRIGMIVPKSDGKK